MLICIPNSLWNSSERETETRVLNITGILLMSIRDYKQECKKKVAIQPISMLMSELQVWRRCFPYCFISPCPIHTKIRTHGFRAANMKTCYWKRYWAGVNHFEASQSGSLRSVFDLSVHHVRPCSCFRRRFFIKILYEILVSHLSYIAKWRQPPFHSPKHSEGDT
jgi:hypothetical protein